MDNLKTNFGKRKVSEKEKTSLVQDVFSNVAKDYDTMNDLMSFGTHRLWKYELINYMNIQKFDRIIDVGSGTGDLLEKISQYNTKFAVEQRSLMETIAGVVNLKTHTQQADARRKKSKTKQRSAPLRLHWVQDNTHGVANNSSISSPSSHVTSTSTSKFIVAGCQIAIVNGVYQQKGIAINTKRNRLDLSLSVSMENFLESSSNTESSPWFWKEESNVYLVREIAQDGSVGWVIGTEKDGVLVAAQSLSMSSPPLNNWVRVVKNGCIRSQMELVLLEGGLV